MRRMWAIILPGMLLAGAGVAHADPGSLTITGTASGTIDGTPFSAAAFSAIATFHWSADFDPPSDPLGSYPALSLSFTITGEGTFTSAPGAELFAVLFDPGFDGFAGGGFQLQDAGSGVLGEFFDNQSWSAPTQTVLLSGPESPFATLPFTMPLSDTESLVISDVDLGSTAMIFAPEPGTLSLLGCGLAALGLRRRRRRNA